MVGVERILSPAETGEFAVRNSADVSANSEKCAAVAEMVLDAVIDGRIVDIDYKANPLHPTGLTEEQHVNWVFVLDTLNFSFWPEEGEHYDVTYKGKTETGYLACCAAFCKAHDNGVPIHSAEWMADVQPDALREILKSDSGHEIPLLLERWRALKESGQFLLKKHGGQFLNVVKNSNGSAQTLLRYIMTIESFRDVSMIKTQKVSFLKRAQILIADVAGVLKGTQYEEYGTFRDLDTLTMFADYRVPQVLYYFGCLQYTDRLTALLWRKEEMKSGNPLESQIRGISIYCVQEIYKNVLRLRAEGYKGHDWATARAVLPIDIDVWLWQFRRNNAELIDSIIPFHRCRWIYY